MNDRIKTKLNQTKKFVSEHRTLVACAVTAVVTAKVTRDQTMKAVSEFLYTKGYENGIMTVLLDEAYDFIKEQGLESEFVEYARMVEA